MPDIRYVCLSDMHLGAETSLLTNLKIASDELDPSEPSPVLKQLVVCLRWLIQMNEDKSVKPTLILNGDILEFALATDNKAAMCFERFVDLIMPPGGEKLFERIIYNPGNHDHHLWETARETQYVEFLGSAQPQVAWGSVDIPPPWHTTRLFEFPDRLLRSYFLTSLIQRRPDLKESKQIIETAYPNFGIKSDDGEKLIIFHHGHFTEDMYLLISNLKMMLFPNSKMPVEVWEWEEENFAWIDFFWSTLGRSGEAGVGVDRIYEKLQDDKQLKVIIENLAAGLAEKFDIPLAPESLEKKLIEAALGVLVDRVRSLERNKPDEFSRESQKGLWRYMDGPLIRQIKRELKIKDTEKLNSRVIFVFGHTHKPFERDMNFDSYPGWVPVYNTGGWVVDTVERQYLHGGSVVLIDENLNASSIRMYNERVELADYDVCVSEAGHPGDTPGVFFAEIARRVSLDRTPWKQFSNTVARAVSVRAENLRARINRSD